MHKLVLFFRAIRIHQWSKNTLVFLPLIASHTLFEPEILRMGLLVFVSFSCCSSACYLVNDLFDRSHDQKHPQKKHRPIASGEISPLIAGIMAFFLSSVGIVLGYLVSGWLWFLLIAYFILGVMYTVKLKNIALLDVLLLAFFYTLRIIAGVVGTGISFSPWLVGFSMFFFLSLALIKRYSELDFMRKNQIEKSFGRGYRQSDLDIIYTMGISSGYNSVLVMGLYINSNQVTTLYSNFNWLWIICPLLFYWISYMWFITKRGEMTNDPVLFTLKDPRSIAIFISAMLVLGIAI